MTSARFALAPALALTLLAGCGLEVRRGAGRLSEAFAPPTPQEAAAWALDASNADNRSKGTMLLANAPWGGADVYLRMYEDYADDPEPNVRAAATRALGNHGGPEHASLIARNLGDTQKMVRIEAARAMQRIHNPETIPLLIARLSRDAEPEEDVRCEVAEALGQYPDARVLQALVGALGDRQLRVTHSANRSLRTLTGQDFGLDRKSWLAWIDGSENPFAARAAYVYPVFIRPKTWIEYIPFVPPPPNEQPASPAGMNPDLTQGTGARG